jgi:hypothetical protein
VKSERQDKVKKQIGETNNKINENDWWDSSEKNEKIKKT